MLTVLFASFNGAHTLERTLTSMTKIVVPDGGWEIIAIDNGSTDETANIISNYRGRLPITCIQHSQRGKNRALNEGLKHAKGDLLVFTDDDVQVTPNWLVTLIDGSTKYPGYSLFGGSIRPVWEHPPDHWLLEKAPLGVTYAVTNPAQPEGPVSPGLIWGPNMMVRRSVFEAGFRFDESIGPSVGQYAMGSETEFNTRVASYGHLCCFLPDSVVHHIIRRHQTDPSWVLARAFRFGKNVRNRDAPAQGIPMLFGLQRWQLRVYLIHKIKATIYRLNGDIPNAFMSEWEMRFLEGYSEQSRALSRAPRRSN